MDYDSHLILHHLDDPLRFLKWTLDEAAAIVGPTFLGLGTGYPLWGLVLAGVGYKSLTSLKKRFGLSTLRQALYWHFPQNKRKLPHTPPSYIREWGP